MLDINDCHPGIQINDVDGESHAQSMNAVTRGNPEGGAVTEVTRSGSKQAAKPGPVRIGDGQGCSEVGLAGLIEG